MVRRKAEPKCVTYCVHPTVGFFVDVLLPVLNMLINLLMLGWAALVLWRDANMYENNLLDVSQSYDVNQQSIFTVAHGGAAIAALIDYGRGTPAPTVTFTLSAVYSAVAEFLYNDFCQSAEQQQRFVIAKTALGGAASLVRLYYLYDIASKLKQLHKRKGQCRARLDSCLEFLMAFYFIGAYAVNAYGDLAPTPPPLKFRVLEAIVNLVWNGVDSLAGISPSTHAIGRLRHYFDTKHPSPMHVRMKSPPPSPRRRRPNRCTACFWHWWTHVASFTMDELPPRDDDDDDDDEDGGGDGFGGVDESWSIKLTLPFREDSVSSSDSH